MKSIYAFLLFLPFLANAQTAGKTLNIFTLGDSNGTFAYGWPLQIKNAVPNSEVYNISKSGRTVGFVNNGDSTLNQLFTLDKDLKKAADFTAARPFDYVVIGLGTNDAKAVFADQQDQVAANLETIIKRIKSCPYPTIAKAKIVIVSPPPYGSKAESQDKYKGGLARVQKMSETFKQVAKKNNCIFVDAFTPLAPIYDGFTADGLHMNAEGQQKLADLIGKGITGK